MNAIPRYCAVCLKYSKYRAAEDGFARLRDGRRLKIYRGEAVCLEHDVIDQRGMPITIEEAAA